RAHLESICAAEGITVEPAVLPLVVRAGGGSARDALSILDQLLAGAGPDGVTYARAVALLGVTDDALLDEMVDALAAGDAAAVYGTIDRVVEAGHDPRRFSADLLDRFRDLILLDAVPDAATRGLLDAPQDSLARMSDQAARLGAATLTRHAEIVHTSLIEMRGTTSPRLVLELLCARMQLPDASADSAALLQRVERLERRATAISPSHDPLPVSAAEEGPSSGRSGLIPSDGPSSSAGLSPADISDTPAAEPAAPAAPPPVARESGQLDAAALRRLWPDVLDVVKQSSRRTRALLDNAQITTVDGDVITLAAPPALAKMIAEESNSAALVSALSQVVGGSWRIAVDTVAAPSAGPARPATASPAVSSAAPPTASQAAQPEPDPRDDTEPDQLGERVAPGDPEAEALRLLQAELGARPVES
ncbi:MAG TPA: DNA polymerase III subunit gamma/tau, partial [Jatrophihabitantaceae bacterium]|nr:DNA polymerase III subunit gamma/tau [Jatrophihabitantaceae bacterium]